jgi:hypothetical protein
VAWAEWAEWTTAAATTSTTKYGRAEFERRFLLKEVPPGEVVRRVRMHDRYIEGARRRLRKMVRPEEPRPALRQSESRQVRESARPSSVEWRMRLLPLLLLASLAVNAEPRDGSKDFDPLLGKWRFHLKRLVKSPAGAKSWVDLEGTADCRKVWDGALIEHAIFDGGGLHIEGAVFRTYNPATGEWRLHWVNRKTGVMDPPQIGRFDGKGHGEFIAQDFQEGKTVLVKFAWDVAREKPHFEQSYSDDGGKTWEVNWITDQTRVSD